MKIEEPYAKYRILPDLSYKIIEHLMTDSKAEILWKLLKYNESDAWSKPDLTLEEKRKLIYPGGPHQEDYSVFFDYMMDDAEYKEKSYLRIYPSYTYPKNRTIGIQGINFEVYVHSKLNHLNNYTTRIDVIIQTLLEVLNGTDVGSVGLLYFDAERSSYDKIQMIGMKPFKGKTLTMSVNIG